MNGKRRWKNKRIFLSGPEATHFAFAGLIPSRSLYVQREKACFYGSSSIRVIPLFALFPPPKKTEPKAAVSPAVPLFITFFKNKNITISIASDGHSGEHQVSNCITVVYEYI